MESPTFPWLTDRASGILLHPTSLPGPYGIGCFSQYAKQFIDFLNQSEILYWQVLPLGPTGYGDSPYQSFSAFAGNPYLIDLTAVMEARLLSPEDLTCLDGFSDEKVDYGAQYKRRWPILRLAFRRFCEQKRAYLGNHGLFEDFKKANREWLEPYCAFMALKERFGGKEWTQWPSKCRSYDSARQSAYWDELQDDREAHAFFQYLFYGQWKELKEYAHSRGVEIIGDIPIFVAYDSADVWASPELFELDENLRPKVVAGVPPDYFSETGQFWGNPLYRWDVLKKRNYDWWIERLKSNLNTFDVIRIDHFRGFWNYWRIPAEAQDARSGKWTNGPQFDFFNALHKAIPDAKLIAEDLGEIDQDVFDFRDALKLPGMAVLQFAFDLDGKNLHLPHNHIPHSAIYPGTHDNDTALGWYESTSPDIRDQVRRYFRGSGEDISWDFIRAAYRSVGKLAIIPMQDLLALDESARMNVPGDEEGNWQWRMTPEQLQNVGQSSPYLRELAWLYGR